MADVVLRIHESREVRKRDDAGGWLASSRHLIDAGLLEAKSGRDRVFVAVAARDEPVRIRLTAGFSGDGRDATPPRPSSPVFVRGNDADDWRSVSTEGGVDSSDKLVMGAARVRPVDDPHRHSRRPPMFRGPLFLLWSPPTPAYDYSFGEENPICQREAPAARRLIRPGTSPR
jgi:hypothetical protein